MGMLVDAAVDELARFADYVGVEANKDFERLGQGIRLGMVLIALEKGGLIEKCSPQIDGSVWKPTHQIAQYFGVERHGLAPVGYEGRDAQCEGDVLVDQYRRWIEFYCLAGIMDFVGPLVASLACVKIGAIEMDGFDDTGMRCWRPTNSFEEKMEFLSQLAEHSEIVEKVDELGNSRFESVTGRRRSRAKGAKIIHPELIPSFDEFN